MLLNISSYSLIHTTLSDFLVQTYRSQEVLCVFETETAVMLALLLPLLLIHASWSGKVARASGAKGNRFVCTAVPAGTDISCPVETSNRVQSTSPQEEELRSTIIQLRETILQQKETIVSQQGTIKELNSKLARCEADARSRGSARRKEFGKNTMGDLPRDPAETVEQLGKTMQSLKDRLENLEVRVWR